LLFSLFLSSFLLILVRRLLPMLLMLVISLYFYLIRWVRDIVLFMLLFSLFLSSFLLILVRGLLLMLLVLVLSLYFYLIRWVRDIVLFMLLFSLFLSSFLLILVRGLPPTLLARGTAIFGYFGLAIWVRTLSTTTRHACIYDFMYCILLLRLIIGMVSFCSRFVNSLNLFVWAIFNLVTS
jgi:hypothetical protein